MSAKFMKNAFVGWTFTAGLYYPADFDGTKLEKERSRKQRQGEKGKPELMNIRMMFPFTMICDSCGEYNYTGTKFTSKVERIKGESFLGMTIFRFYGRCKHCWSEFTFKTDPKHSDYTMESGGKRTYEAWHDADQAETTLKRTKEEQREHDAMLALEQKSVDVQAEMQRIEDLDAIRTMNKRLGDRDDTIEKALEMVFAKEEERQAQKKEDEEDADGVPEELREFREAQELKRRQRLDDEVEDGPSKNAERQEEESSVFGTSSSSSSSGLAAAPAQSTTPVLPMAPVRAAPKFVVKRKAPEKVGDDSSQATGTDVSASKRLRSGEAVAGASSGTCAALGKSEGAAEAAVSGLAGGLGLCSYDSDSSA